MKAGTVAAALALLLSGCAPMAAPETRSIAPQARYVSMGSSFAAGANVGTLQAGSPERCGRTTNNYASLLADRMDLALTDVGCGGAKTDHILGPWDELPPQIEAVTAETRLVTITIGGNDVNYVGWLFAGSCKLGFSMRPPPCPSGPPPGNDKFTTLYTNLRGIAAEVHRRAPNAKLVFVQYVTLVSDVSCPLEAIDAEDARVAKDIALRLSTVTEAAARDSGALVLNAETMSANHTPCSAQPWANGLHADYDIKNGAPWHPNAAGHAAIAEALFQIL
jgi:lysophospholipase L1-like esterase